MTNKIRVAAKRSLGQNFLVNEGVADRIIAAAAPGPGEHVLEVGPGTGMLTRRLASTDAQVVAVEKDRRLIGKLTEAFAGEPNVSVIEGDIREWTPPWPSGGYAVIANIPYYLTSFLLRLMWERWPQPSRAVLMVQAEVADRIMADPPDMNLLALSVRLFAVPSRVMRVSRGSFRPSPDVDSAVIRLDRLPHQSPTAARALALARAAFGHKRKKLTATIDAASLERAGISPSARPQELSAEDWLRLAS